MRGVTSKKQPRPRTSYRFLCAIVVYAKLFSRSQSPAQTRSQRAQYIGSTMRLGPLCDSNKNTERSQQRMAHDADPPCVRSFTRSLGRLLDDFWLHSLQLSLMRSYFQQQKTNCYLNFCAFLYNGSIFVCIFFLDQ